MFYVSLLHISQSDIDDKLRPEQQTLSPPLALYFFDILFFGVHSICLLVEIADGLTIGDMDGLIDGNFSKMME